MALAMIARKWLKAGIRQRQQKLKMREDQMTNELRITRRHAFGIAALPVLGTLSGSFPAFAQTAKKIPMRVVNTSGLSAFVFQELLESQGILDAFGIEVTNQNVADGTKVTEALLTGTADICPQAGFGPVLTEIDNGKPLKVIGGGNLLNPQAIYSAKPEIKELKDLVGRTVGVGALGAAIHQKVVAILRKRGIDEKQVKFINVGSTLNIFKATQEGKVDAGVADIDVYADQAKYGVHSLSDANLWRDLTEYTNQAAYTTVQNIAEKRDGIVRVMAAYAKLYRFLQSPESRDPWLKTWAKIAKTEVPSEPDPQWRLYQEAKPFPPEIALSAERIRYVQELNVDMGLQKNVLPFEQISDPTIARDALKLLGS